MIYKSRNGIGTRVILITLFFFFMLTDACNWNPKSGKELAEKCNGNCSGISIEKIYPDLNEANGLDGKIRETISAIKKIRKKKQEKKNCRRAVTCFELVVVVALVLWLCAFGKNKLVKWCPCIESPSKTTTNVASIVYGLHDLGSTIGWIIFGVLLLILVILPIGGYNLGKENEACNKLELDVKLLLNAEDVEHAIIQVMVEKIEMKIEEDEIVTFVQNQVAKHKKAEKNEEIREAKIKGFEETIKGNKIQIKEFETKEVESKTQFGEEIKKMEVVKEAQFEAMKKNDTETKYQLKEMKKTEAMREEKASKVEMKYKEFIEEKQKFMESAKKEDKNRREREEKNRRERDGKKDDREESPLAKIDVNLFIYAMVFVFALFAICTICNFDEEERTGEIIEV